jgi:hypothetical protein
MSTVVYVGVTNPEAEIGVGPDDYHLPHADGGATKIVLREAGFQPLTDEELVDQQRSRQRVVVSVLEASGEFGFLKNSTDIARYRSISPRLHLPGSNYGQVIGALENAGFEKVVKVRDLLA